MPDSELKDFESLSQLDHLTYQGEAGLRAIKEPIRDLLTRLRALPSDAGPQEKIQLFKNCILELNALNRKWEGDLLATDEREDIMPLLDQIAERVGLRPYEDETVSEWLEEWHEF